MEPVEIRAKGARMNWRMIETSREIRLWTTQIIVPAVVVGIALWQIPEVRSWVKDRIDDVRSFASSIFSR